MKHFARFATIAAFVCLSSTVCFARVARVCKLSYLTQAGWSAEEPKSIDFVTGYEISNVWPQVQGDQFYALIWFSEHDVALVHLPRRSDLIVGIGSKLDAVDFSRLFSLVEYVDGDQINLPGTQTRQWRVRAKDNPYTFIDEEQNGTHSK